MIRLAAAVRSALVHNRPSRKPQLWENLCLAAERRLRLEMGSCARDAWFDEPRIVSLSSVGFSDGAEPLLVEVTPRESVNRAIFLYGTFEISETRLIQAFLRPGMTFVDAGAHLGYYSLIGARLVGAGGRIHSFEPGAAMRERLQANVARNALTNVEIHDAALAAETGVIGFYPSAVAGNMGISSILPGDGRGAPVQVPSLRLDDFVDRLASRQIDLMKIDVEGAALQVIAGGRRTLGRPDAPALILEAHVLAPVEEALAALGYRMRRLHYTLEKGLELIDPAVPFRGIFDDYEAPNYFAAKDQATFTTIMARANTTRSPVWRLLGRI